MRDLKIGALRWSVGTFCAVVGAAMLVVPHQFEGSAFVALQRTLPWWGIEFLLVGSALLSTAALRPRRALAVAAHLVAGAALLLLAYGFGIAAIWTAASNYLVLGLGTALAPLTAGRQESDPEGERDLLPLVLGTSAALTGVSILVAPDQFSASHYDLARPLLPWYAAAFLVSGLGLAILQIVAPPSRWVNLLAHLFAAGVFFAFFLAVPLPSRTWTGIAYFGGFGAVLALLPWLSPRLGCLDLASLRARLALALGAVAALLLILVEALHSDYEQRLAVAEALQVQQTLAGEHASDVADYVGNYRAAVAGLAAQPGLLDLSTEEHRRLLRALSSAYPDVVAFSTYSADGNPIARSDDLLLQRGPSFAAFDEARRTNQPSLDILVGPPIGRPVFALGAPIRGPNREFAGLALGVVESAKLAEFLDRFSLGIDGVAYLVDGRGRAIAHTDESVVTMFADLSGSPPVNRLLSGDGTPGSFNYPPPGGERLAGYARVPGLGWGLVVDRPRAIALASYRAGQDLAFGMLLALIGIAAVIGAVVADRLTAPLTRLARAVERFPAGEATAPLPCSSITEIARLANALGEMRDRLAARTSDLEQAEAKFRRFAENARDIVCRYELKPGRGYSYVSPVATEVLGYSVEEHYADPDLPLKVAHPDDRPAIEALLDGRRCPRQLTTRARHRDGHEVWLERLLVPIVDASGALVAFESYARDITERKRAEEERAQLIREQAARAEAEATAAKLRRANGQLVMTGIRAQQAAEEAAAARERVVSILESITDAFVTLDRHWRFTYLNRAAMRFLAQFLESSPEELIGKNVWEEFPEAVGTKLYTELHRAVAEQITVAVEEFYPSTRLCLGVHAYPGRDGLSIYFRDITEHRRAEEEHERLAREQAAHAEAEAARQRFAFLAEASAALAGSLDYETTLKTVARLAVPIFADGCIVDLIADESLCQAAVAHVDPSKEELLGAMGPAGPPCPAASEPLLEALQAGRPKIYLELLPDSLLLAIARDAEHLEILRKAGITSLMVIPLLAHGRALGAISFISGESGRRYGPDDLALAEELARRCALAIANARLHRQAQEAIHLRDKILSTVSHDLKNPLAVIKGHAQMLKKRVGRRESLEIGRIEEGLAHIDATATKMAAQVGELLDVARLQMGRPIELELRPTDLVALARDTVAEYQQETNHHRIIVDAIAPVDGVWDSARLERVLGNLLSNAVKYSPAGGDIIVRVVRQDDTDGSWAIVEVADPGLGIPAADLPHIFEWFHRAGNVAGQIRGTGVGLASVRQIVEQHGGTISVKSEEQKGSIFTVRLPLGASFDAHVEEVPAQQGIAD